MSHTDFEIISRLEAAGKTLLALRDTSPGPRLAAMRHDIVRQPFHDEPSVQGLRLPAPSAADIALMDEALTWVLLVPQARRLREIVTARMMVHPVKMDHIYSWRRIGMIIGMDHRMVQRRHAEAIKKIILGMDKTDHESL